MSDGFDHAEDILGCTVFWNEEEQEVFIDRELGLAGAANEEPLERYAFNALCRAHPQLKGRRVLTRTLMGWLPTDGLPRQQQGSLPF